jgi:cysteinyl-tRNA synthetase
LPRLAAGVDAILEVASDFVAEALDKERGSSVTDGSIFRAHAAKYEVGGCDQEV